MNKSGTSSEKGNIALGTDTAMLPQGGEGGGVDCHISCQFANPFHNLQEISLKDEPFQITSRKALCQQEAHKAISRLQDARYSPSQWSVGEAQRLACVLCSSDLDPVFFINHTSA